MRELYKSCQNPSQSISLKMANTKFVTTLGIPRHLMQPSPKSQIRTLSSSCKTLSIGICETVYSIYIWKSPFTVFSKLFHRGLTLVKNGTAWQLLPESLPHSFNKICPTVHVQILSNRQADRVTWPLQTKFFLTLYSIDEFMSQKFWTYSNLTNILTIYFYKIPFNITFPSTPWNSFAHIY
jgi:hypothetical protein